MTNLKASGAIPSNWQQACPPSPSSHCLSPPRQHVSKHLIYDRILPHDSVDLKLGLQLALQLDCLKKVFVLLMVLKIQLFLVRETSTWQRAGIYMGQQCPQVPGQAHWKHAVHTSWWWGLVLFKLSYLCSPPLREMLQTCSFSSENSLFVSLLWNWFHDWGCKKLSPSPAVLVMFRRLLHLCSGLDLKKTVTGKIFH